MIVALLYFFYPDKMITGNISLRLLLLFFLTLLIWLSSQRYPAAISIIVMLAIIPISIMNWEVHMRFLPNLADKALEISEVSRSMEETTVYIAVNYSSLWTEDQFTNMPGIDKSLINANAPQIHGQFPLMVNKTECPQIYLGTKNANSSKIYWALIGNDTVPVKPADYVILIKRRAYSGNPDQLVAMGEINKYYVLTDSSSSKNAFLYELRNRKQLMDEYNAAVLNAHKKIQGTETSLSTFYRKEYLALLDAICLADSSDLK